MFIIRASNLVSMHNTTLGGNARNRLFYYTQLAVEYLVLLSQKLLSALVGAHLGLLHAGAARVALRERALAVPSALHLTLLLA